MKPEAVKTILSYDPKIDLFAAAGLGDYNLVEDLLMEGKFTAYSEQKDGMRALMYAVRHGQLEIVDMLMEYGAFADTEVSRWWMEPTPLHSAALHGQYEITVMLLEDVDDVDCRNEYGYTPFLVAARWKHLQVLSTLLEAGADIHAQDNNGYSALDWAAGAGNYEMMEYLIKNGFDVNLKGPPGTWSERTALHFAVEHGRNEVVRLLLDSDADASITNKNGQTAYEAALFYNHPEIANILAG